MAIFVNGAAKAPSTKNFEKNYKFYRVRLVPTRPNHYMFVEDSFPYSDDWSCEMVSPAETLASSLNMSAFSKATELKSRIWFTLLALIVYRLGTYIPVPGIDPVMLGQAFNRHGGGILGMFDMFAGGALKRMTIFALNVMPYITASIIVQLLSSIVPAFEAMKKEGEAGHTRLNQYSRYLTVFFAIVQSSALAIGLENMGGSGGSVVILSGMIFRFSTIVTLTGGTIFLMWLGEQITARGIGNGTSMIIYAGIVRELAACHGADIGIGPHRRSFNLVYPVHHRAGRCRVGGGRIFRTRATSCPCELSETASRQ